MVNTTSTSAATSEARLGRRVVVVLLWLALLALGAGAWRLIVTPHQLAERELATLRARYNELDAMPGPHKGFFRNEPSSPEEYREQIARLELGIREGLESVRPAGSTRRSTVLLHLDSFSGYAVLRSKPFKDYAFALGMLVETKDDGGNSAARFAALRNGEADFAVFTLDALLREAAKAPTSGVGDAGDIAVLMVLDETVGADAMVAFEEGLPSLAALASPGARLVLTGNSPSETLARVVMASFEAGASLAGSGGSTRQGTGTGFGNGASGWQLVNGSSDVLNLLRKASKDPVQRAAPVGYVLWEPELSFALQEPGVRVLFDSSRFRGFIVDVLVTTRKRLSEDGGQRAAEARGIIQAYARTLHELKETPTGLRDLVIADTLATSKQAAAAAGSAAGSHAESGITLSPEQAQRIVDGIWWKSLSESAAHLGLNTTGSVPVANQHGLTPLDDILAGLIDVLAQTGALTPEQLAKSGRRWGIFHAGFLTSELRSRGFHPAGKGAAAQTWPVPRTLPALPELSPQQWDALRDAGTLRVPPVVFARGSATLTDQGRQALRQASRLMVAFPQYYLTVQGHARSDGNPQANQRLAQQRSQAVLDELLKAGVESSRVRARAKISDDQGSAVTFSLGEAP
jgi:outer membrane protein OmpA-like peptidoglycan-associated protein